MVLLLKNWRYYPYFWQLSLKPTNNAILYVGTMLWAMLCSHLFIFFAGSKLLSFFYGFQFKIVNLKLTLFQKYHLLARFCIRILFLGIWRYQKFIFFHREHCITSSMQITDRIKVFENLFELCALWMHLLQALLNRLRQTVFRNSTANTLFWADLDFSPYLVA